MTKLRIVVCATILAAAIAAPAAYAQSTMSKPAEPSTADQVKNWTQAKWDAMKAEWQKDKAKWDSCNLKATDKKLIGKDSWSYIYDCMKA